MPRSSDTHAETVADPAPARPKRRHVATGRPASRPVSPEIAAIEAEFTALTALTDCVDFELACAIEEGHVIEGLRQAVLAHRVGCTTIRRWAALLVRVQNAQVEHAEHIAHTVLPECRCEIAAREAALAEQKAA